MIELGNFVKLDRCQGIARIDEYNEENKTYYLDKEICDEYGDETFRLSKEDVLDTNKNILALIKVGDFINGKQVVKIIHFDGDEFYRIELFGGKAIMNIRDIESIVTKEEFERDSYYITH